MAITISGGRWKAYPWVKKVLNEVQRTMVTPGGRLIINAPPQHGKSESTSHYAVAWHLENFPDKKIILASYGASLATKFAKKSRDDFTTNPTGKLTTRLKKDSTAADDWETTELGGLRSAGFSGAISGMGAHLIIIDDPFKDRKEAESPTIRQNVIDTYKTTLLTRLATGGSIIVIQTRWHENDLTGYLLSEEAMSDDKLGQPWKVLAIKAIAEEDDILGRSAGDALCPELHTKDELLKIKRELGPFEFSCLYQQSPVAEGGNMIKGSWIQTFEKAPAEGRLIQSWDLSFSKTESGSYVVGQVWLGNKPNYFLLDQIRERMSFTETLEAIRRMTERWPNAATVLIEDKANGPAVISMLKKEIPGIIAITPKDSKEGRLSAVSGLFEAGNVSIPAHAPWMQKYIDEMTRFPAGTNDDQVDATTMALDYFISREVDLSKLLIEYRPTSQNAERAWMFDY
jgi:predicted phage terminase large subunit-like protein